MAEQLKLKCSITKLNVQSLVTMQYEDKYKAMFNCFAQVERCEAIEEILKTKIDFEYLE